MKQSFLTGEYIFNQIIDLKKEVDELGRAMDMIADDYSKDHAAYSLLEKAYNKADLEMTSLLRTEYLPNTGKEIKF